MTVTDQVKILDDKIKSNQARCDLGREAAKISALSSKDLLEKCEYLTGEDLGHKPNVFEKTKFQYSPLGMTLNEESNKDEVKGVAKSKSAFNYDSNHTFFEFYKSIDEFKDMSLGSKYIIMKNFNKRLIKFNKTDKESKLDEETKKEFKEIEKRKKIVDKERFMRYFDYEPSALVIKLLIQNTQDLK